MAFRLSGRRSRQRLRSRVRRTTGAGTEPASTRIPPSRANRPFSFTPATHLWVPPRLVHDKKETVNRRLTFDCNLRWSCRWWQCIRVRLSGNRLVALDPAPLPAHVSAASRPGGRSGVFPGEESPGSTERRCRSTTGEGDLRESATENRPLSCGHRKHPMSGLDADVG